MIYLASPYTHPSVTIREERYHAAVDYVSVAVPFFAAFIFSPIVYWHPVALRHDLPGDAHYWEEINRSTFKSVTALLVLDLDGWQRSVGIGLEIKWARDNGLPIHLTGMAKGVGVWIQPYSM